MTNSFPNFVAIEVCGDQYSELAPVSIAWSLSSGEIKSTLISPDDDWEFNERLPLDLSYEQLVDHGASVKEIVREFSEDCESNIVFTDDAELLSTGLSLIFEAANSEFNHEVDFWYSAEVEDEVDKLLATSQWLKDTHNLSTETPEERVQLMLLSYNEHRATH